MVIYKYMYISALLSHKKSSLLYLAAICVYIYLKTDLKKTDIYAYLFPPAFPVTAVMNRRHLSTLHL